MNKVTISADEGRRQLIIQDSGLGMTKEDMANFLGRIGHSGTAEFLQNLASAEKTEVCWEPRLGEIRRGRGVLLKELVR